MYNELSNTTKVQCSDLYVWLNPLVARWIFHSAFQRFDNCGEFNGSSRNDT